MENDMNIKDLINKHIRYDLLFEELSKDIKKKEPDYEMNEFYKSYNKVVDFVENHYKDFEISNTKSEIGQNFISFWFKPKDGYFINIEFNLNYNEFQYVGGFYPPDEDDL